MTARILLVEDTDSLRSVLVTVLEREGYGVDSYSSAETAIKQFKGNYYDCIVTDFKLGGIDGLEFLKIIRETDARVPVLLMTAFGTVDLAVQAMRLSASDFITKPFEPTRFLQIVRTLWEQYRGETGKHGSRSRDRAIRTRCPEMLLTLEQARRVARVDSSVMIFGESGTGKELLARFIHEQSSRADKPFVAVNCAALPAQLLESEFFGHEAGAFTGAVKMRVGLFEHAAEGTIFLDEIGDMPKSLQVKLLRALQEREIKRVGSSKTIRINPRVIAATNCSERFVLETERLREDLYYRLAVVTFELVPLRCRPEDLEILTEHFLGYFSDQFKKTPPTLSPESHKIIHRYDWPGNIRELENVIERAVLLAEDEILPEHLGLECGEDATLVRSLREIADGAARTAEIAAISLMLRRTVGNKSQAARELGVSYKTLLHKVREYGLDLGEQRPNQDQKAGRRDMNAEEKHECSEGA